MCSVSSRLTRLFLLFRHYQRRRVNIEILPPLFGEVPVRSRVWARPASLRAGALMQLISCVAGFITVSLYWIFSGILILIGAGLAFLGRKAPLVTVK